MPLLNPATLTGQLLKPLAIIRKELIIMLYRALYPYIAQDFRHNEDCVSAHKALSTHTHETTAPGAPTLIPITIPPDTGILTAKAIAIAQLIPDPLLIAVRNPKGLPPHQDNQPFTL